MCTHSPKTLIYTIHLKITIGFLEFLGGTGHFLLVLNNAKVHKQGIQTLKPYRSLLQARFFFFKKMEGKDGSEKGQDANPHLELF